MFCFFFDTIYDLFSSWTFTIVTMKCLSFQFDSRGMGVFKIFFLNNRFVLMIARLFQIPWISIISLSLFLFYLARKKNFLTN